MSYIALTYSDLAIAALLILINGAISLGLGLGLERTLAISAVRMVVQLSAVGFVLKFIFAQVSPLWTAGLALIMVLVAGREVIARQSLRHEGWRAWGVGTTTLLFVGTVVTVFGVGGLIQPDPWYAPRFFLPILGMVLGNTMTGIALTLDRLSTIAKRERVAIEAHIAMGARRFVALEGPLREAVKAGAMPIVNAMAASGLVSLPGMMTGQILSGVDPIEATKYQVMIMFLIAGATGIGVLLSGIGGVFLLTDERHRLRLDRLRKAG